MPTTGATPAKSRIFISYRREDTEHPVGRLAEDLRKHFPRDQVFQDIASIDPGADFVEALQQGLETCAAVLVVIGPRWLTVANRQGRRRLDLPDDWVRHEVAESLRRPAVRVFPVLLDAEMPSAEDLPEEIRPLTRRQAFPLTVRHWPNDVAQLIEFLERVPGLGATPAHEAKAPQASPASESAEPPASAVKVDRTPAASTSRPARQDESAHAGSAPGAEETQKRGEDVRRLPELPAGPSGRADSPARPKVLWALVALGAVVAIALLVFFTRGERPETPTVRAPQPESTPTPTAETPPAKPQVKTPAPDAKAVTALKVGETFRDCNQCPPMVVVPGGRFLMGSPTSEEGRFKHEGPQHEVRIAKPFAVGRFEVTFDDWDACVAVGDCNRVPTDSGWGRGKRPVIDVSWDDAQAYVAWLSKKTGQRYRLLSEAEWEYAARAGTTTRYPWGNEPGSNRANFGGSESRWSKKQTAPVGSFDPNKFGLHDVIGNVYELVQDCWKESYAGAPADGSAWEAGNCGQRVVRGGSWNDASVFARAAFRAGIERSRRAVEFGFRVARTL